MALKYLVLIQSRGRHYAYYRRDGLRMALACDPTDQAALLTAWQAAHAAHEAANRAAEAAADARIVRPGSIGDLIARYRASPEWSEKRPATRADYEKALRPLEDDFGKLPVVGLQRHHVTQLRDRYAWREAIGADGKPQRISNARQANRVVTVLSILLTYSIASLGWRGDNPAARPRRLKRQTEGYRAWTPAEFQQFWARSTPDWQFAAALALLTAQRGQDQVAMTWADYDGARIYVVQEKGGRLVKLWVPVHDFLRPLLEARKKADAARSPAPLTILSRPDATPWPVNAWQKAAGVALKAAGLSGVVWHGLRGTGMSWAAEGGASENALMALAGHKTASMSQHYARGARREGLAAQAVAAIEMPALGPKRRNTARTKV